jgi:hypothetical protein
MSGFPRALLVIAWLAGASWAGAAGTAPAGDPEGAAKQYRIARRLAAENSPDAGAALAKVFSLDPTGPLADDALVDQALLLSVALWPGDLGRVLALEAEKAAGLFDRAIDGFPGGDRASEARVLRALLRLEPVPGRDPARARLELLSVAATAAEEEWRNAARLGIAWIDEQSGERERARSAYQRLAIDAPTSLSGARARIGLARLLMRDGKPGRAAALLEEAARLGAGRDVSALGDLAVREALRRAGTGGRWSGGIATTPPGLKSVTAVARLRSGGLLLADRREGVVLEVREDGTPAGRWSLEGVQALVEDPMGRRFLAAGESLYRLGPTGPTVVAQLGAVAPVSAMAADGWGRLYVLGRRGDRMGVLDPGALALTMLGGDGRGVRLTGLAWDGARIVSLDAKSRSLVEVLADGNLRAVGAVPCEKPEALAADPSGEVAVLDAKAGEVILLGPDGQEVRDRLAFRTPVLPRADGIALGVDGSLDLLSEGSGTGTRFP